MTRFLAVYTMKPEDVAATIFPGDGIDVMPVVTRPPEDLPP